MGPGGGRGDWKGKANKGLAWFAFILAVVAGAAITGTFIGDWVATFVGLLPDVIAIPLFIGGLLWMAGDLFADGVPNKPALYLAMVLASWSTGLSGTIASSVQDGWSRVFDQVDSRLAPAVGAGSTLVTAVAAVVASLVIARRTVQGR